MKEEMKKIIDKLNELVRLVKKILRDMKRENRKRERWWKDFEKRRAH